LVSSLGKSTEGLLQYHKQIESDTISGSEVAEELDNLVNKMKSMRYQN
jgi:hypothetical protein